MPYARFPPRFSKTITGRMGSTPRFRSRTRRPPSSSETEIGRSNVPTPREKRNLSYLGLAPPALGMGAGQRGGEGVTSSRGMREVDMRAGRHANAAPVDAPAEAPGPGIPLGEL